LAAAAAGAANAPHFCVSCRVTATNKELMNNQTIVSAIPAKIRTVFFTNTLVEIRLPRD